MEGLAGGLSDAGKEPEIDTADHVAHAPTGETWVVARVSGEHLYPCGWPPSRADLGDCTLVKKATAAERNKLLQELAAGQSEHATWASDALGVKPCHTSLTRQQAVQIAQEVGMLGDVVLNAPSLVRFAERVLALGVKEVPHG